MVAMPLFGLKKGGKTMRKYLYSENGFVEKAEWKPNCWVNVECPDDNDFQFLTQELKVPESFLEDIADTDERPRTETEGNWLLTILRIPMQSNQHGIPFITVPIGIITNNDIIVSVCYHHTELIPDFIAELFVKAGVERFVVSPIPLADNEVECAHGTVPYPAPALAAMLPDVAVRPYGGTGEPVTPTGLAVLKGLGAEFGPWPRMTVEAQARAYARAVFEGTANGTLFCWGTALPPVEDDA